MGYNCQKSFTGQGGIVIERLIPIKKGPAIIVNHTRSGITYAVSILSVGVWLEGKNCFLTPTEKTETVLSGHICIDCI